MEAPVEGVGPQCSRILRLALDAKGYPRGDMLSWLYRAPLADALDLERVSHRARHEIKQLEDLAIRRMKEREAAGRARRG